MGLLATLAQLFPERGGSIMQQGVTAAPGVASLMPDQRQPAQPAQGGLAPMFAQPPSRTAQAFNTIGATLKDVGVGLGGGEGTNLAGLQKTQQADQQRQQYAAWVSTLDLPPAMKFLALTNPEGFAAAYAKTVEPFTLGKTRYDGGGHQLAHEDQIGQSDGFGYHEEGGKIIWDGERPANHGEVETGRHNIATETEAAKSLQLQHDLGFGHLGIEQQNANANTYRAHKAPAGGPHPGFNGLPSGFTVNP